MDDLLKEFLTETNESLDVVDNQLVKFEQEPNNAKILDNIFRLVHTIKGTCGFLGLPRLEALAHAAETLMGKFRDGMPPTFTTILAEHLARASRRPAREGVDGEPVKPGQIYLAPGGRHMRVARQGSGTVIALDDGPPVNFCKPAVDPLFTSAIGVWQGAILAVVLTGMGSDGTRGGRELIAAGGSIIAQDEATSVVWGMPGSAANAGICSAVLPLGQIAPKLNRLFSGDRS